MKLARHWWGRLTPALLLAVGVALLMTGLFSLASPAPPQGVRAPGGDPALTPGPIEPDASPAPLPAHTPGDNAYLPGRTPPTSVPSPSPSPPAEAARATRVVIPSLRIDLPVVPGDLDVRGNPDFYPLCDVAQYMLEFVQPGEQGTAYIYAHAQRGMFRPMLRASTRDDGAEMVGALVEVYTADSQLHLYEIFRVKRHATDFSLAFDVEPGEHRLVLQTSEGPTGTVPKLQVAARPIAIVPSTAAEALPDPEPRPCPPR